MTSPAQLKYLDAMGIPVWVSRDLVQIDIKTDDQAIVQSNDALGQASQESNVSSTTQGHVNSLLHDLDAQTLNRQGSQGRKQAVSKQQNENVPRTSNNESTSADAQNILDNIDKQATEIGRTAHHAIYACGDQNADWMVIGESPDVSTNGQGQPYAGDSGILLTNMLRAVGIEEPRRQAYLVNILNFSIRDNDTQKDQEKMKLNSLLLKKIQSVNPKMLLLVGQISAQNVLNIDEPLVRMRGKKHILSGTNISAIVTYYPSYLLSKPLDKRKAWEDLKLAMRTLSS